MLHLAMAAGLVAGLLMGLLAAATGSPVLLAIIDGIRPLGTLFVNAIRMVVIPLVVAVLFAGVARLGSPRRLGRMGGTALAFIFGATSIAIVLGMAAMRLALPLLPPLAVEVAVDAPAPVIRSLVDFLVALVPANPFEAATRGDLLALIVFTALVAAATGTLPQVRRERLITLADDVAAALSRLVQAILWTAPVGIFALAAPVTARAGWAMLQNLAVFVGTVIVALLVFFCLVFLPLVRFVGRTDPLRFLRASGPATLVGFTTTSSVAALPVLLDTADEVGLSDSVASVVLPLAVSLHRSGSALFQGAAIVFLASVYGVDIPSGAWLGAFVAVFLAALSVGPIPSASVMTLAPALEVVGVPIAGLALLLGVDRIPDMFRTAVNVNGHMVGALVVEGTADQRARGLQGENPGFTT